MRRGPAVVVLALASASPALAHTVGLSRGEYLVSGAGLRAEIVLARGELKDALPGLDADGDGAVSGAELAVAPAALGAVARGLEVRSAAGPCAGSLEGASLLEEDGLAVRSVYKCDGAARPAAVRMALLSSLSLGHRHLATATAGGETVQAVLHEAQPEFALAPGPAGATLPGIEGGVAWPLFRLGVEHILTGYDHLVFLLGLVLVGGRLRALLVAVTAFTAAHSLTLALAAMGVIAPSPRLVEPAIALSIAYVGVENWFVRDTSRRWVLTFPFGLVHGFGFAGALGEISLPQGQVPLALVAFNSGVEAGQVGVLAIVLPAIWWLGRKRWFARGGVRVASGAIAMAGVGWLVARLG
jgi:hydrogenase/urease accessory protein HupE